MMKMLKIIIIKIIVLEIIIVAYVFTPSINKLLGEKTSNVLRALIFITVLFSILLMVYIRFDFYIFSSLLYINKGISIRAYSLTAIHFISVYIPLIINVVIMWILFNENLDKNETEEQLNDIFSEQIIY